MHGKVRSVQAALLMIPNATRQVSDSFVALFAAVALAVAPAAGYADVDPEPVRSAPAPAPAPAPEREWCQACYVGLLAVGAGAFGALTVAGAGVGAVLVAGAATAAGAVATVYIVNEWLFPKPPVETVGVNAARKNRTRGGVAGSDSSSSSGGAAGAGMARD